MKKGKYTDVNGWKQEFGIKVQRRRTTTSVKTYKMSLPVALLVGFSPAYPVIIYWALSKIL